MPCSADLISIPPTLSAGDSFSWQVAVADYPATAGWTLHLGAACASPLASFVLDAQAAGAGYTFAVTPGTSVAWKPGRYVFALYLTKTGQRVTVARGAFQVLADPAAQAVALDHAHRTLALIEAALERRIPAGLEETTIDGQQLGRITITDLHDLRDKYRSEVRALERAAAVAAGVPVCPRVRTVRFVQPGSLRVPGNFPRPL